MSSESTPLLSERERDHDHNYDHYAPASNHHSRDPSSSKAQGESTPAQRDPNGQNSSPQPDSPHPTNDPQSIFRALIGMNPALMSNSSLRPSLLSHLRGLFTSRPTHSGYFKSILDEESRAHRYYLTSTIFVDLSLLMHILIAATITALSASGNFKTTITTLAAINTALASTCAYIRGQGLPYRMGQYVSELRLVRDHAVFVDAQFGQGVPPRPERPEEQARLVQRMYEAVRKDEEDNAPDVYTKPAAQKVLSGMAVSMEEEHEEPQESANKGGAGGGAAAALKGSGSEHPSGGEMQQTKSAAKAPKQ